MTDRPPKFALLRRAPRLEIGRVADLWDFGVDAECDFTRAQLRLRLRLRLATRGRRAAAICRQRAAAAAAAGRRVAFGRSCRDFGPDSVPGCRWSRAPGLAGRGLMRGLRSERPGAYMCAGMPGKRRSTLGRWVWYAAIQKQSMVLKKNIYITQTPRRPGG